MSRGGRWRLVGALAAVLGLVVDLPVAIAEPRVVSLGVRAGVLPGESRTVRVDEGDEVTLEWTTDSPLTLHLHGYDLERKVVPGATTSMRFTAKATGRFPIEVHAHGAGGDRTIGYLEVHPR